jgi:hypothetical protein
MAMVPIAHPGRLLRREIEVRGLSANRLALDLGVPSGRITDILNERRSISADTRSGSGVTSAMAASSGSISRASTISPPSSASAARRSPPGCARRRREGARCASRAKRERSIAAAAASQ